MLEMMPPPDLPAFFSRAATAIRRSAPCAGAAIFVGAAQVITKPGVCTCAGAFLPLQEPHPGCVPTCRVCNRRQASKGAASRHQRHGAVR